MRCACVVHVPCMAPQAGIALSLAPERRYKGHLSPSAAAAMSEEFYRIKRLPPYVFAEVNRLKARYRAEGMDIIDFGMGNPDMDTPSHIVEKLVETVRKPADPPLFRRPRASPASAAPRPATTPAASG